MHRYRIPDRRGHTIEVVTAKSAKRAFREAGDKHGFENIGKVKRVLEPEKPEPKKE